MEITAAQIESFRSAGHVAIGPLVDFARLAELRAAFESLEARWAADLDVSVDRYRAVVSQWTGLWEQHAAFAAQIHHPAVERIARELLGADQIQLFHDHLISKPPEVSSTVPWHQDFPFWPVDRPRALSAWLSLDDATADAGALHFMPGAHLEGEQAPVDFLARSKDWGEREKEAVAVPVPAGHVIFHDCLSWHYSPPNTTADPRRAFIAIYMDAACCYAPEHSGWHPMNEHVTVAPGQHFNEDRFPRIRQAGGRR